MSRGPSHAHREHAQAAPAMASLRRSYFARAGLVARRYGIGFDRIVGHLWRARRHHEHLSVRGIRYLDDLVHAVACLEHVAVAWSDLTDLHERALVRRCRVQLEATASMVAVRRLLAELRESAALESYDGREPLRAWLSDRLMDQVARARCADWPSTSSFAFSAVAADVIGRIPAAAERPRPSIACHVVARRPAPPAMPMTGADVPAARTRSAQQR